MKTPLRQILWSGIILPCICACSNTYTPPDAPICEVPFTQVHLEDSFWAPRIETNREVSIPSAFKECEKNGRFDNFAIAGGLKKANTAAISRSTTPTPTKSSKERPIRWP